MYDNNNVGDGRGEEGVIEILNRHNINYNNNNDDDITLLIDVLQWFYNIYNNKYDINKIINIANKYNNRRIDLWHDINKKYNLVTSYEGLLLLNMIYNDRRIDALNIAFNINDNNKLNNIIDIFNIHNNNDIRSNVWKNILFNNRDDNNNDDNIIKSSALHRKECYNTFINDINIYDNNNDDEDNDLIIRDLNRTMQDVPLFNNKSSCNLIIKDNIKRILLIYCKLNGIKYVQGMNQLCCLLYYIFRNEYDTFWALSYILDNIKDIYIKECDNTTNGIYNKVDEIRHLLLKYDPELYKHIDDIGVNKVLITIIIRWLSTLFTLDINELNNILLLWDILIIATRFNKLSYYTLSLSTIFIILKRYKLLNTNDTNRSLQILSEITTNDNINDLIWLSVCIMIIENYKL